MYEYDNRLQRVITATIIWLAFYYILILKSYEYFKFVNLLYILKYTHNSL